jgi:hypothetical protein
VLTAGQILASFTALNDELRKEGQKGEIGIVGGAVMCLVYNARLATRDVDAVFEPSQVIRRAAAKVAEQLGLPQDWLNDGAKGYLAAKFQRNNIVMLSNLVIWAPEPRYMLAMKCLSARWDTSDRDDVVFLCEHLEIQDAASVFAIIQDYYPKAQIPAKTQFFIEELFPNA